MNNRPTTEDMSIRSAKKGFNVLKALKQNESSKFFENLEQGKSLEYKQFALFASFIMLVFIAVLIAFLSGIYLGQREMKMKVNEAKEIGYVTAAKDCENNNVQP